MRLHNLKGLRTLMVVRDVSQRRLAGVAGYKSHAYMGRILRGEVDTLAPEAASRIARFLQVSFDYLFVPHASTDVAHSGDRHRTTSVGPRRGNLPAASRGRAPRSRIQGRDT